MNRIRLSLVLIFAIGILKAQFSAVPFVGSDTALSCTGYLTDHAGASNYSSNANGYFVIDPPGNANVSLEFGSFNTEAFADYVKVYDGVGTSGTLMGNYSGVNLPNAGNKISSSSGAITVAFTSNASITNTGFFLNWSTDTSNLPIASFVSSHSSVNFNSPVQFFNTTQYGGNSWWDFGDGTTSTDDNPAHSYTSAGVKTVFLVASNCKGVDTSASYNITVLPPPSGSISQDTLTMQLDCGGSDTASISVTNVGLGLLDYEFTLLNNLQNYDFHSTWENGGLDGFVNQNSSLYSATNVTSSSAPQGSHYLKVTGDGLAVRDGLKAVVSDPHPEYISYYVKSDFSGSSNGYIAIRSGSGSNANLFYSSYSGTNLRLSIQQNGNLFTLWETVTLGQWSHIELKNIDYVTHTFDLYLDGVLKYSNALFVHGSNVNQVTEVQVYHIYQGNIGIDDMKMGSDSVVDYVSFDPIQDTVAALNSDQIEIIVDGANLGLGNHQLEYAVLSNDPNLDSSLFVLDITVNGYSEISLPDSCIDLGVINVNQVYSDSLWIGNAGCDTLRIDSIHSTSSITVNSYSSQIDPNDSVLVQYQVLASTLGNLNDSIFISSPDTTGLLCVSAQVVGAPQGSVSVDTVTITVPCTGSDSTQFYISNLGLSDLNYELDIFQLMSVFDFRSTWENGGLDGFVNQNSSLYTATNITSSSAPQGSHYLKVTGDGLAVRDGLKAVVSDPHPEYISYYVKSDYSGSSNGYIAIRSGSGSNANLFYSSYSGTNLRLSIQQNGSLFTLWETVTLGQWSHIELKNIDYVSHTFDLYLDGVLKYSNALFVHGSNVNQVTEVQVYHIYQGNIGIDDMKMGSESIIDFITYQPESDTIIQGDSTMINVAVDGTKLTPGVYHYDFIVASNDVNFDSTFIPIKIIVEGKDEMSYADSCIQMGVTHPGLLNSDTLLVWNSGCDTLSIDSISSNNPALVGQILNGPIPSSDTTSLVAQLLPNALGTFIDTLTIYYGDSIDYICVNYEVKGAPIQQHTPQNYFLNLPSCKSNIIADSIVITNTGLDTLDYEFKLNYLNGSNWISLGTPWLGSLHSGDTARIPITIDGSSLSAGNYAAHILIESNDPVTPVDTILIEINITSAPMIVTNVNCLHFGQVAANQNYKDSVLIYNDGCSNLSLTSITTSNASFIPSSSSATLIPGDSIWLGVTFYPLTGGPVNALITIANNDTVKNICLTADVIAKPQALFDDVMVNTCDGIVGFTDNSQNTPTSWEWNFGDGTISYAQNPIHAYTAPGFYSVVLKASNPAGVDSLTRVVDVTNALYPDFLTPDSIYVNQPFQIYDSSLVATSWQWFFGDGVSSTAQHPIHTYTNTGVFSISFFPSNGFCNQNLTKLVTVYQKIGIDEELIQSISLYPNPASHSTRIEWSVELDIVKLELVDFKGMVVESQSMDKNAYTFELSKYPAGIYFIRLSTENSEEVVKKLIIE